MDTLPAMLDEHLPVGITAGAVAVIDPRTPSLQQAVTACTWRIDIGDASFSTVAAAVERVLAAKELIISRVRKVRQVVDDIHPLVQRLDVAKPTKSCRDEVCARLTAELGTQPRAVRVPELPAAFDPATAADRVQRTHQWIITGNGRRTDPMGVDTSLPAAAGAI